jgi:peroxiredoxin
LNNTTQYTNEHTMNPSQASKQLQYLNNAPNVGRRQWMGAAVAAPLLTLMGCADQNEASVADTPFTTLDGKTTSTSQLQGRVALVNFWATSCSTCVQEMPQIIATFEKFKARGLETLAVAMQYDPPAYVMAFAKSRALPFKVTMDLDGRLAKNFGDVQITPTTFLLDKKGRTVKRYVGVPDFDAVHALIDQLLLA